MENSVQIQCTFLTESFLEPYKKKRPPFGFNGLGEIVYLTHYSRVKEVPDPNNNNETSDYTIPRHEVWWETIERVVNGVMNQLDYLLYAELVTDKNQVVKWAEKMYDMMFNMHFLPGGRGLWAMGADVQDYAALNNCGFISTKPLDMHHWSESFEFMMNMMMLGVGIGFDTLGIGYPVYYPRTEWEDLFVIEDSREGWVSSVGALIRTYTNIARPSLKFDYSNIRPKGERLKHFGGTASGPEPLKLLHERIRILFYRYVGRRTDEKLIVDLANVIGAAVVAGGIRRTAMIGIDKNGSDQFLELKNYDLHPERREWGWASNNSVKMGLEDFKDQSKVEKIADNILRNGEPGIFILENAKIYGRFLDRPTAKDYRAEGTNPCGEMTLENYELCNLVEINISKIENLEHFEDVLEMALLYGKVVSTMYPKNRFSREVMKRNHRIGISLTGIADFLQKQSTPVLADWMNRGWNTLQNKEFDFMLNYKLPSSIKLTTIKPSGTLSLVMGCTPGIHYPIYPYVWRRMCLNHNPELEELLHRRGYDVYEWRGEKYVKIFMYYPFFDNRKFGNLYPKFVKRSIWEQKQLVDLAQNNWSDNQVSCTIYIPKETTREELVSFLNYVPLTMKSVSLLPDKPLQKYENMPFEPVEPKDVPEEVWNQPILLPGEYLYLNRNSYVPEEFKVFCEKCENGG